MYSLGVSIYVSMNIYVCVWVFSLPPPSIRRHSTFRVSASFSKKIISRFGEESKKISEFPPIHFYFMLVYACIFGIYSTLQFIVDRVNASFIQKLTFYVGIVKSRKGYKIAMYLNFKLLIYASCYLKPYVWCGIWYYTLFWVQVMLLSITIKFLNPGIRFC